MLSWMHKKLNKAGRYKKAEQFLDFKTKFDVKTAKVNFQTALQEIVYRDAVIEIYCSFVTNNFDAVNGLMFFLCETIINICLFLVKELLLRVISFQTH